MKCALNHGLSINSKVQEAKNEWEQKYGKNKYYIIMLCV